MQAETQAEDIYQPPPQRTLSEMAQTGLTADEQARLERIIEGRQILPVAAFNSSI